MADVNKPKYQRRKDIFVDVDRTILVNGELNQPLHSWLKDRRQEGFRLYLWSARGEDYARAKANDLGVTDMFHLILSKPGYIVDDMGLQWNKYIKTIHVSCVS